MIQRQQTLWLMLATAAAVLSFMFPFVTGKEAAGTSMLREVVVDAGSNLYLLLSTGASIVLSSVSIFLYKNRAKQMWFCVSGLLISVVIILLYVLRTMQLTESTLALYCVLPLIVSLSYFMALRGIRKDQQLIKSLDKLR